MKKTMKTLHLCLLAVIIIFGVVVCISYYPRRIRRAFSGIELLAVCEYEFEFLRTVDININGRLHNGMFAAQPRFRGLIELSEHPHTIGNEVNFSFGKDFSYGFLQYTFGEFIRPFGTIPRSEFFFFDTNWRFSYAVLREFEWKPLIDGDGYFGINTNRIIVAPATDINSAIEIFRYGI